MISTKRTIALEIYTLTCELKVHERTYFTLTERTERSTFKGYIHAERTERTPTVA